MAKYIYKQTHFFATTDPKRIIKMSLKVLYASWGLTACYSMTFAGLYISSSPRAVATGSHHEKPILPKITVAGQVARKSSRPKSYRPEPELCRPKCIVMSPEILSHVARNFYPVYKLEEK